MTVDRAAELILGHIHDLGIERKDRFYRTTIFPDHHRTIVFYHIDDYREYQGEGGPIKTALRLSETDNAKVYELRLDANRFSEADRSRILEKLGNAA